VQEIIRFLDIIVLRVLNARTAYALGPWKDKGSDQQSAFGGQLQGCHVALDCGCLKARFLGDVEMNCHVVRQILLVSVITLMSFFSGAAWADSTIYTDAAAPAGGNGRSWETAFRHLQNAVAASSTAEKPVEIRIAQGLYKPDQGPGITAGDRTASFAMISGVALKGGYAGRGSSDPNARDIQNYATLLSGDLHGNDVAYEQVIATESKSHPTWTDNSHIVVQAYDVDSTAVLDGVVVTHAHSDDDLSGGLVISQGGPVIRQCTFSENIVYNGKSGAGITIYDQAHPILTDCVVTYNTAWEGMGGGSFTQDSHLTLVGCTLSHNRADIGGAIAGHNSDVTARHCRFSYNQAHITSRKQGGGAISQGVERVLRLEDCQFLMNRACHGGAIELGTGKVPGGPYMEGTAFLDHCLFAGNIGTLKGSVIWGEGRMVLAKHCTFTKNRSYYLGCIDFWGTTHLRDCILWDNDYQSPSTLDLYAAKHCCLDASVGYADKGANIQADPCFVDPGYWEDNHTPADFNDDLFTPGDYHLKSQAGHWDVLNHAWLPDEQTSPCIDTANPDNPIGYEPFPNGGRLNMGVYGGTVEASKSYFGKPPCQTLIAGDINGDCLVDARDLALMASHWLDCVAPTCNQAPEVYITAPGDGWEINLRAETIWAAAYAWDVDGSVVKVEFFFSGMSLEDNNGTNDWYKVEELEFDTGVNTITAQATDDAGAITVSDSVVFTAVR